MWDLYKPEPLEIGRVYTCFQMVFLVLSEGEKIPRADGLGHFTTWHSLILSGDFYEIGDTIEIAATSHYHQKAQLVC